MVLPDADYSICGNAWQLGVHCNTEVRWVRQHPDTGVTDSQPRQCVNHINIH